MAKIIKAVARHSCYEELPPAVATNSLWYGSVVECSCGKRYMLASDQRDGDYWSHIKTLEK